MLQLMSYFTDLIVDGLSHTSFLGPRKLLSNRICENQQQWLPISIPPLPVLSPPFVALNPHPLLWFIGHLNVKATLLAEMHSELEGNYLWELNLQSFWPSALESNLLRPPFKLDLRKIQHQRAPSRASVPYHLGC